MFRTNRQALQDVHLLAGPPSRSKMDAPDAKAKTRQENESLVAADEFSDDCDTDLVACSKRELFASQKQQRSIEYEEIVASCVSYTMSSPVDQQPPIDKGDVLQIISFWSTVEDGVVNFSGTEVSAKGVIIKNDKAGNGAGNQSDKTKGVCFQCHDAPSDKLSNANETIPMTFKLIPCQIGGYDELPTQYDVLSAYTKDKEWKPNIVSCDDTVQNQHMHWNFERATKDSKSSDGSASNEWRLCVDLDENGTSKKRYLAANRNGELSLCDDCLFDSSYENSLHNPQTYFYLYKKKHKRPIHS